MKIAVIGSTGFVGSSLIKELELRNFETLAISRQEIEKTSELIKYVNIDVNNIDKLVSELKGYDVLISAFSAGWNNQNYHEDYMKGSVSILTAASLAGISRFIVVGGSGSLYVKENVQAVDTDMLPLEFKTVAKAARAFYLEHLKQEESLEWLYVSPPFEMHPGIIQGRTGNYRTGILNPIFDESGKSSISVEDLSVAIIDEIENKKFTKTIYTVAY